MALKDNYWQYLRALLCSHQGAVDSGGSTVDVDESIKRGYRRVYKWQKDAADALDADTTAATFFGYVPTACKIVSAAIVPSGALVSSDVDYATIIVADQDTVSLTDITTLTAVSGGSGDWVAGTAVEMNLTSPDLEAGDTLAVTIGKDGAGVVVPACAIVVVTEEV